MPIHARGASATDRCSATSQTELSAPRGPTREALGLIRGGVAARWEAVASDARAPWGDALRRLTLPLAAATSAILVGGWAVGGTLDLGVVWTALLAGSLIALAGAVAQSRVPTLVGALMVLGARGAVGARRWHSRDAARGFPRQPLRGPARPLGALPPLAAIAGALGARRYPAWALAAALALVVWTPEAVWVGTGFLPIDDVSLPLALAMWSGGGLIAGLAVLGLVRRAARQPPPGPRLN